MRHPLRHFKENATKEGRGLHLIRASAEREILAGGEENVPCHGDPLRPAAVNVKRDSAIRCVRCERSNDGTRLRGQEDKAEIY